MPSFERFLMKFIHCGDHLAQLSEVGSIIAYCPSEIGIITPDAFRSAIPEVFVDRNVVEECTP